MTRKAKNSNKDLDGCDCPSCSWSSSKPPTKTKKAKPATVGEKIELDGVRVALYRPNITLDQFRHEAVYDLPRKRAKKIDSAIKRAVKEAWYSDKYMDR